LSSQLTWEGEIRRIKVTRQPGQKTRLFLKDNQSKEGWRCGSSSRAPEFESQYSEKRTTKNLK
jgi:hypothetical protein